MKLDVITPDTPSVPIKATAPNKTKKFSEKFSEHSNEPPSQQDEEGRVTAVAALIYFGPSSGKHNNNQTTRKKVVGVLLDSGSDGDLLFHQKGTPKHFPYSTRQVPNSWHTSNGVFQTKGRGTIPLKFFEYSNSKRYTCKPDIVEYAKDADPPVFDLIIGCQSMKEWGIDLSFCKKTITIDGIILPMRNTNSLTKSKIKTA